MVSQIRDLTEKRYDSKFSMLYHYLPIAYST
jgi:hypothetical protein